MKPAPLFFLDTIEYYRLINMQQKKKNSVSTIYQTRKEREKVSTEVGGGKEGRHTCYPIQTN